MVLIASPDTLSQTELESQNRSDNLTKSQNWTDCWLCLLGVYIHFQSVCDWVGLVRSRGRRKDKAQVHKGKTKWKLSKCLESSSWDTGKWWGIPGKPGGVLVKLELYGVFKFYFRTMLSDLTETPGKFLTLHLMQVCPSLLFNFAFQPLALTFRTLQSKRLCLCSTTGAVNQSVVVRGLFHKC